MIVSPRQESHGLAGTPLGLLHHLQAMTGTFTAGGRTVSYVHIYTRPVFADRDYPLRFIVARETGYEGIACVDDTARAAVLAFGAHAATGDQRALDLASGWLSFVEYMQGEDGRFANFILDEAGARNLTGPTSAVGGYGWTARALWALGTAWRRTGDTAYLRRFNRCPWPRDSDDMKMNALMVLALLEVWSRGADAAIAQDITMLCDRLVAARSAEGYLQDLHTRSMVYLWGYHQLAAVARAGRLLGRPDYLAAAQDTVEALVRPVAAAGFYYQWPPGSKEGLTAYCVTPLVQGVAELYRATGDEAYRDLALRGCAWFAGDNDAGQPLYNPTTGQCSDGLDPTGPSQNHGAESAIEAGFAELERRALTGEAPPS